ncbi:unnamed protein product [Hymenolepis diminuta]|uniref:Uncharacterized protein n=1 Tax=Hymenolepis diminuta TaxID=6216 RepID=A0A564XXG3_HYMDI|nr:unnamed protein product [Hymenolepis diminuta]
MDQRTVTLPMMMMRRRRRKRMLKTKAMRKMKKRLVFLLFKEARSSNLMRKIMFLVKRKRKNLNWRMKTRKMKNQMLKRNCPVYLTQVLPALEELRSGPLRMTAKMLVKQKLSQLRIVSNGVINAHTLIVFPSLSKDVAGPFIINLKYSIMAHLYSLHLKRMCLHGFLLILASHVCQISSLL